MMRRALVTMFLLAATSASACITVEVPAREFLHGAVRVFRGTATDLFMFHVVKVYRGDDQVGEDAEAAYSLTACGAPEIKNGEDYLIIERSDHVGVRRIDRAADIIAMLDAHAAPVKRAELIGVLRSWQSGKRSTDDVEKWFEATKYRDVDDWDDDNASLTNDVINRFTEIFADRTPAKKKCPLQQLVAARTDQLVLLLKLRVDQTDFARASFDEWIEDLGRDAESLGCSENDEDPVAP